MSPYGNILKASDFKVKGKRVFITSNKKMPGMLLVWGDFCSHCHKFLPTFNNISNELKKGYSTSSIESKELENANELVTALNFQGYPTIYFYDQNGMIMKQYNGSRDKASILKEICDTYHHCIQKHLTNLI